MGAPTAKLETVVVVSPYKVLGLFFNIVAMICLILTMPTTFWFHVGKVRYGLWTECRNNTQSLREPLKNDQELDKYINAFVFALITFVLLLISLFTDNWLSADDVKQGLWRNCTLASSIPSLAYSIRTNDYHNFYICVPINRILWIQICGALIVVCLCCTLIGLVLTVLGFFHKKRQDRKLKYYRAATFVYFSGALCSVIGLAIFPVMFLTEIQERGKEKWYFGWSYGLAWGSAIFLLGAALLLCCDRNKEEIFYRERLYLNNQEEEDEENQMDNQEAKIKTLR